MVESSEASEATMANAPLAQIVGHLRRTTSAQSLDDLSDAQLLANYRQKQDEAAFAEIVRRHGRLITAACHQLLDDQADVDDVFQATFLVFLREAKRIRAGSALGGWLYRVAYRLALKLRQKQSRRRELTEMRSPEPDLSWREACIVLHEELDRLPPKFRLPLVSCYLDGRSRDEAAKQLGWTEGMVKGRLERGREALRRRLTRRGVSLSAGLMAALASSRAEAVTPQLVDSVVRLLTQPGDAPALAAALAAGVPTIMNPMRKWLVVTAILAIGLLGAGAWLAAQPGPAEPPKKPEAEKPAEQLQTPAQVVAGKIVDENGKPIAGARLYRPIIPKELPRSFDELRIPQFATSDKDGTFRGELPKDEGDLGRPIAIPILVAADGHGFNWIDTPKLEDPKQTVQLPKEHRISGRVIDTQGKPLAGLKVEVASAFAPEKGNLDEFLQTWKREWETALRQSRSSFVPLAKVLGTSSTDKDGRFELRGIGVEQVAKVQISGRGVAQKSLYVVNRPGFDPKPINSSFASRRLPPIENQLLYAPSFEFVATPTKTVEGVVTDARSGKPIVGASISAMAGYGSSVQATTDNDGRYKLTGVSKQKIYYIHAMPPKSPDTYLSRSLQLPDNEGFQPIKADFELNHGVILAGRLIDKSTGKGVVGSVRFAPLPDNAYFRKKTGYDSYPIDRTGAETDSQGRFKVAVIPGSGVLMAQAYGSGESLDSMWIKPWLPARFDEADAKKVTLVDRGELWTFDTAGGTNEFLQIENAVKCVDSKEDSGTVNVDLYVHRGKTRMVKMLDVDGKPLEGVMVSGMTAAWPITHALTKHECTIYALEPNAPRTVVFHHAQRNLATVLKVTCESDETLTAKLGPTGAVKGRMLDLDGQPLAGVEMSESYADEVGRELIRHMRPPKPAVKTDADGRFQIDGVVPGLDFSLGVRKDRKFFVGEPRIGLKKVEPGQALDLGDRKMKPQE
jgi:RNA polymerase sigma factor (sigma-70 family)